MGSAPVGQMWEERDFPSYSVFRFLLALQIGFSLNLRIDVLLLCSTLGVHLKTKTGKGLVL